MSAYKVTHSNQNSYQIRIDDGTIYVNEAPFNIDYRFIKDNEIHFIMDNHASITARVIAQNFDTKEYIIDIQGTHHTIKLEDKLDILMDNMAEATEKR